MNIVKFPGLGLEFQISRIAFYVGNIAIYYYALCIVFRYYNWFIISKI